MAEGGEENPGPYRVRAWLGPQTGEPDVDESIDDLKKAMQYWASCCTNAIDEIEEADTIVISLARANGNIICSASLGMPYGVTEL